MAFSAHTSEAFAKHIENLVATKGMSYMEAVLYFCEQRQLEPDAIALLLNDKIKNKIGEEAQGLHLIPKRSALPV